MPISSPRLCPVLVDRESDLAALDALLSAAAAGHGRQVLVTGEAGAGKSRLLREAAARAAQQGFQQVTGGCTERDREFPFAPIVDALRQFRVTAPAERVHLLTTGAQREALAELLPELRESDSGGRDAQDLPPEQAKRRLFEAIGGWFIQLAQRQPLLVVLEDLHWADPTTLELLEILPRRLAATRALIVATARPDEPNPDLQRLIAILRRSRSAVELSVGALGESGVGRMVQALLAAPASPALVAAIHARTDGNPFFVEELMASAPSRIRWLLGDTGIPETIQDAVVRQTVDLDATARDVLDYAAIIGQRFSFELLQTASAVPPERLLAVLQILLERNLIVTGPESGQENFAFRHALTRDALHDRLLAPRRRVLHRVVGEALEQSVRPEALSADDARNLSYHFHAAGVWGKTLAYATLAGASADRLHATVEALTHHRRALDAALALDDPQAAALNLRCGLALSRVGAFDDARNHLEAALALSRQRGLREVEQAALHDLAGLYASRDYPTARRLAGEALVLARAMGDSRREGMALNRLGNVMTNLLRFDEGRTLHEDALALFEHTGDRWGSADSLDLIGMARYLAGEVPEARVAFSQAAASFADLGDSERVASALTSSGLYLAVLDGLCATSEPPESFHADAAAGFRICQEIAWRSGEAYALVALASAAIGSGAYGVAREQAEQALAIAEEIGHPQWQVIASLTLGILDTELCDLQRAEARIQGALDLARQAGAAQWTERLEAWLSWCRARSGADDRLSSGPLPEPDQQRLSSIGQRRAAAAATERALAQGRPELALRWANYLLAGAAGPRAADAVLLRAKVLAALGSAAEADAGYLDARRIASEVGPRSVLWRVAAARATLWRNQDAALTVAETETARAEIEALAATIGDDGRRSAFLASAEVRPWAGASGRRRTADRSNPGGLTDRERQVAVCVSQGLSNKEIAFALSIAEKTVEMHVSSCLGKLQFASRAQIAAWVVSEGLAAQP